MYNNKNYFVEHSNGGVNELKVVCYSAAMECSALHTATAKVHNINTGKFYFKFTTLNSTMRFCINSISCFTSSHRALTSDRDTLR